MRALACRCDDEDVDHFTRQLVAMLRNIEDNDYLCAKGVARSCFSALCTYTVKRGLEHEMAECMEFFIELSKSDDPIVSHHRPH